MFSRSLSTVLWLRAALILLICIPLLAAEQKEPKEKEYKPPFREGWVEVHTTHFGVVTDAGEKRGREVALRLEQMQAVFADLLKRNKLNYPTPVQVLALKSDKDYGRVSPVRNGVAISAPGFFLADEDQYVIVLNLFEDEPWRAITHDFAHMLLDGNYPPTQAWFDEGLAEYFSSIRVDNKTVELGGDPELAPKYTEDIQGNVNQVRNQPKSLTELLSGPVWLRMNDLFTTKLVTPEFQAGTHHSLFYAQSWMVMHYLLSKKMLPQVGTYFGLVQIKKEPVAQAFQEAFGMTPEQFEQAVKEYFKSLQPLFAAQDQANTPGGHTTMPQVAQYPAPFGPENVAMVVRKLSDDDAHAIVADVMARQPERRLQGIKDLQALEAEPMDNDLAHRSLAFAYMQQKDFKQAAEELQQVIEDAPKDAWARYYSALLRFKMAQAGQPMEGALANVQQNLRMVIDWDPQFAEAYHMLGLAELEGGGTHAAVDTMRTAIQLAPRKESYVYNLAEIYMAGKKWDEAQPILERLKTSMNPQIAAVAKKKLDDLPFIRKYGIPPERAPEAQPAAQNKQPEREVESGESESEEASANATPKLKERKLDKRPVQHIKGKLVSVDCSQAPSAVVIISSAGRVLKLRSADYKSLVLIGADQFSCDWKSQAASANYKASGKTEGDLVSLEID
jgi:tetratricopeptide (TPR) repeat protein